MSKLYLVWNREKNECVGFLDPDDADYARSGFQTTNGVSSLADTFRELYEFDNDEGEEAPRNVVEVNLNDVRY